ncbi:NAD(P)/FAD-dependent oxidoreductase [Flexithrix dorotheae]|uniref:NAD(P)/FAD-dependent oxidoreductase n=1 Tax=Flexithrix dorotheae TaxID=70993 RepID=UPI0003729788|nr:NAD(P)/FAD-dependent oxidoreductase [Flexithrix dorotheae]
MKVLVIGGGAAGFFAAINCATKYPNYQVDLFEKSSKLLSKVKVSGGGRCNLTHSCFEISRLVKNYPRGAKQLKKAFNSFMTSDTIEWFESRGVKTKTEPDGRMFPVTDNSQTIINCLVGQARQHNVNILTNCAVSQIVPDSREKKGFKVSTHEKNDIFYDKIIIATGGSPKLSGFNWLKDLGHEIVEPVPSLFTFNMPKNPITKLMGLSVNKSRVKIMGTKLNQEGPLLITHWGMSGPAVLKLSAWGARLLQEKQYQFSVQVSWVPEYNDEQLQDVLTDLKSQSPKKQMGNTNLLKLPARLWEFLLEKAQIPTQKICGELSKKDINRLINLLTNDVYEVNGKTTFKEEFVTCGGVSLGDVDFNTMESRKCPGIFFAGEVLNIDGVTGGFNFQAAWTTGYIAGTSII